MKLTKRIRMLMATPSGRVGLVGLAMLVFLALFAPLIWGDAAETFDTAAMLQGPTGEHPAGTDGLGRDVMARVLVATRPSLWFALLATALASVLGITLGVLPSVVGRRAARALTGLVNMLVAFPGLILALFVAVAFGVGATGAVVALGVAGAPSLARLTHTLASSVAGTDYVAAARVLGVSRSRIAHPAHPAEHRRAARAQRDHRDRRRTARILGVVVPGPRRPATVLRLGPDAQRGSRSDLRQPGWGAWRRVRRSSSPG